MYLMFWTNKNILQKIKYILIGISRFPQDSSAYGHFSFYRYKKTIFIVTKTSKTTLWPFGCYEQ